MPSDHSVKDHGKVDHCPPLQAVGTLQLSSPRTIFILADSGAAIRNILRTDVYRWLRQYQNLRIVIFTPMTDSEFVNELGGHNVFFEQMPKWKPNFIVRTLRSYRKDLWGEMHEVVRFREKRAHRKKSLRRRFLYALLGGTRSPADVEATLAKLDRLERKFTPPLATKFFAKYRPDLVFFTTMYGKDPCIEIAASQQGVKTCAFILSWDNPTTKGPFPIWPDTAIVWNNIMREELLKFHKVPDANIFVSGPPQFDIYLQREYYASRDEFFRKWKLDPAKRLLTYTTGSPGMLPFEHEIVQMLHDKIKGGAFKQPCQLLVRLHPKDEYAVYERFENTPGLVLQLPGRRGETIDSWNPTREDMYGLGETMLYSDVVVNIASTITIDAAAVDTPIVNLAFDGLSTKPYEKSCRRYYQFNHYKKIVETGGVTIAENLEAAVAAIQRYLDHPELEAQGRARIRQEQCHNLDGRAGERIGRYLISLLDCPKSPASPSQ